MTAADIKRLACQHFKVSMENLEGESRTAPLVFPRHCAMAACAHYLPYSMKSIGEEFGNRHHSSVIHAVKTVADWVSTSPPHLANWLAFNAKVEALKSSPDHRPLDCSPSRTRNGVQTPQNPPRSILTPSI